MKNVQYVSWKDIDARNIRNHTILLDIDGVLMADAQDSIDDTVLPYAQKLVAYNDVWIVSNTFRNERRVRAGTTLSTPWVETHLKKPSTRILNLIEGRDMNKPLIVIGDKFFTDGVFALRAGGSALLLEKRLTHPNDRWFITLTYIIDDALSFFMKSRYTR